MFGKRQSKVLIKPCHQQTLLNNNATGNTFQRDVGIRAFDGVTKQGWADLRARNPKFNSWGGQAWAG